MAICSSKIKHKRIFKSKYSTSTDTYNICPLWDEHFIRWLALTVPVCLSHTYLRNSLRKTEVFFSFISEQEITLPFYSYEVVIKINKIIKHIFDSHFLNLGPFGIISSQVFPLPLLILFDHPGMTMSVRISFVLKTVLIWRSVTGIGRSLSLQQLFATRATSKQKIIHKVASANFHWRSSWGSRTSVWTASSQY